MSIKKQAGETNNTTMAKIREYWDKYAPHYTLSFGSTWMFRGFAKKTMKALIPIENGIILDGGCGSGVNFKRIIETIKPQLLIGLDHSEEMLKEAEKVRSRLNGWNGCEIRLIKADLCSQGIPFPDNYFDAQVYHLVLYYLPFGGWRKLIPEMFRVAKPGGYVVTADFLKGYSFRNTIGWGWRPILWPLLEIAHLPAYIRFQRKARSILLEFQKLEEKGILEYPSKEELIIAFEGAGFEKVEIVARLLGGGIVLRAFKPK